MLDPRSLTWIRLRKDDIENWLDDEAPYTAADQRHLDAGSVERAYWHLGYKAALKDMLSLVGQPSEPVQIGQSQLEPLGRAGCSLLPGGENA